MEEMTLIEKELNKETIDIDKIIFISKAQDYARKHSKEIEHYGRIRGAYHLFDGFIGEYCEGEVIFGIIFDKHNITCCAYRTPRVIAEWSFNYDDCEDWTEIYDVFIDNYYEKAIVEKLKELKEFADNMKIRDIDWEDLDD